MNRAAVRFELTFDVLRKCLQFQLLRKHNDCLDVPAREADLHQLRGRQRALEKTSAGDGRQIDRHWKTIPRPCHRSRATRVVAGKAGTNPAEADCDYLMANKAFITKLHSELACNP
jgi:type II secretory pathway component PulJ